MWPQNGETMARQRLIDQWESMGDMGMVEWHNATQGAPAGGGSGLELPYGRRRQSPKDDG